MFREHPDDGTAVRLKLCQRQPTKTKPEETLTSVKMYFGLAVQLVQSKLVSWLLGKHVAAVLVRSSYGILAVEPSDRGVGRQLLRNGNYATEEVNRLLAHLSPEGDALVVGAHIGAVAIALATRCHAVVAVEPNPRSFQLLEIAVRINRIRNCELLNVAAADRTGSIDMLVNKANSGGSKRVPQRTALMYSYDRPQRITVPASSLDEALRGRKFELVVMDIEGSEHFALKGMQSILADCASLAVEFVPHHLRNVSGVTVDEFLQPILPHFSTLFIPSRNVSVPREQFHSVLTNMYDRDEGEDGLIFSKRQLSAAG